MLIYLHVCVCVIFDFFELAAKKKNVKIRSVLVVDVKSNTVGYFRA